MKEKSYEEQKRMDGGSVKLIKKIVVNKKKTENVKDIKKYIEDKFKNK